MELIKEGLTKKKYLIKCHSCLGTFNANFNDFKKEKYNCEWCGFPVGSKTIYYIKCPYCNEKLIVKEGL